LLEAPDMRVLTISVDDHSTAIAALRAGAVGHIDKDIDPAGIAQLIVRAARGEVMLSPLG
jgi:DNA-binding NarL/FixJ family response regulator